MEKFDVVNTKKFTISKFIHLNPVAADKLLLQYFLF